MVAFMTHCLFLSVRTIFTKWDEHEWDTRQPLLCLCQWGHGSECRGNAEWSCLLLSCDQRGVQCVAGGKSNRTLTLPLIRDQSLCWSCFLSLSLCLNSLACFTSVFLVFLSVFFWICVLFVGLRLLIDLNCKSPCPPGRFFLSTGTFFF